LRYTELLLHRLGGQAHFPADDPAPAFLPMARIDRLDGIGAFAVGRLYQIAQRRNLPAFVGVTQSGGGDFPIFVHLEFSPAKSAAFFLQTWAARVHTKSANPT
jgi:hypothetical protein